MRANGAWTCSSAGAGATSSSLRFSSTLGYKSRFRSILDSGASAKLPEGSRTLPKVAASGFPPAVALGDTDEAAPVSINCFSAVLTFARFTRVASET